MAAASSRSRLSRALRRIAAGTLMATLAGTLMLGGGVAWLLLDPPSFRNAAVETVAFAQALLPEPTGAEGTGATATVRWPADAEASGSSRR